MIPRLHLFEFEDLPWFPSGIRALHTDNLQHGILELGFYDAAGPHLARLLADSDQDHVVDLCSGATGPWKRLGPLLVGQFPSVRVVFTDKFPHTQAFAATAAALGPMATFRPEPVDARELPADLRGVRTLFTSFHHFRPDQARAILEAAHRDSAPVAVFEYTARTAFNLVLTALGSTLGVWASAVLLRPWSWRRAFWTFAVPVLPLVMTWDGIVSQLRTYTLDEMRDLVKGLDGFTWEFGQDALVQPRGGRMTWMTGRPKG